MMTLWYLFIPPVLALVVVIICALKAAYHYGRLAAFREVVNLIDAREAEEE